MTMVFAVRASAQNVPAASADTPSIRLGTTIFANYTCQSEPTLTDADGNTVHRNAFDLTRAYLNVTGNLSRVVAFRLTPDIARETDVSSALSGSLVFRIKYGFVQTNLDDWTGAGSYARFGIQQTPYLDYMEGIYRYRFQGTMFTERAGYYASADAGASFRYAVPGNYGEVHFGVFNGENYNKAEVNNQKGFMVRGTARPFAAGPSILRGLRAGVFYDADRYVSHAERTRLVTHVTFEQTYVHAGFEYLDAHDQTSAVSGIPNVHSRGYSVWATPKQSASSVGWEGLLRFDHLTPNRTVDSTQDRVIVGVAYWFPHQGNVTSALMVDYDGQLFENVTTAPNKSVAVHALVNF